MLTISSRLPFRKVLFKIQNYLFLWFCGFNWDNDSCTLVCGARRAASQQSCPQDFCAGNIPAHPCPSRTILAHTGELLVVLVRKLSRALASWTHMEPTQEDPSQRIGLQIQQGSDGSVVVICVSCTGSHSL